MGNEFNGYGSSPRGNSRDTWREAIEFLELLRSDYQGARKQLQSLSETLEQKEAEIDQHLRQAMVLSSAYRPLCLVSSREVGSLSLMGSAILSETIPLRIRSAPMRLQVRLLGRFEVRTARGLLERWQSVRAKSVFQYLLTRPRLPVLKDALMEALWPNSDPESAGNNLKTAIHGLRRTLGTLFHDESVPYVVFIQGSYLINQTIELWLDVEEFEKHWTSGRNYEKNGMAGKAANEFEQAESLYRGDYLEDEPYEEWTMHRREALKDTYLTMLGKLADYALSAEDYESSIVYSQKILAKDECREDAYRRIMCCHSRLGRRNRALDWYEICRRTIWSELDAVPERETDRLYQGLLKNERI